MTAILLATYNGDRWLDAQLASLFGQTDQDWCLVVSDDGSTDDTLRVLEGWRARYPGRITVTRQVRNLGYQENFRWLLSAVEADTYFFCDQDDEWHRDKVAALKDALATVTPGRPTLAFGDLEVIDAEGAPLAPSLWRSQRTDSRWANDLRRLMVINPVTGCAAALNRAARDLVLPLDFAPAHDHALAQHIVRAGGVLVPLERPLVRYRQHGGNTIGARPFLAGLGHKLTSFRSGWGPRLADRAVAWGLFRSRAGYYRFKARLWVERLFFQ